MMWRMSIEDIIAAIVSDQTNGGGSREERVATAHLVLALFHVGVVDLARGLRRANVELVSVTEGPDRVSITVEGATCCLSRSSGQPEMRLQFIGYSGDVVPHDQADRRFVIANMTVEVAQLSVTRVIELCAGVIRQDLACRGRRSQ